LISAATQDKCRADRRAEKEGSFHLIVDSLLGSRPEGRFPLAPLASYHEHAEKASCG
jgi:hypothetical protein